MTQDKDEKKEVIKEEMPTEGSCCSFSNTEELLKKLLGESLPQTDPALGDLACGCGCESHSHSETPSPTKDPKEIKDYVKSRYAGLIEKKADTVKVASCCSPVDTSTFEINLGEKGQYAEAIGYTKAELKDLPADVTDISFGCGNPTAIAELQPGETVLDLGSGGGIDVFLAAKKVGPTGKAIGLDMTPAMIERANVNAQKVGLSNVEFKLGEIEAIPLVDKTVDVVISNCVINLSPDKGQVFRQIFRVLKPGGRLAVSDIVLNGELPAFIKQDFEAWAGCVAGALQEGEYLQKIKDAGFINIEIESKRSAKDIAFSIKQNPEIVQKIKEQAGLTPEKLLERVVSIKVKAFKPN